MTFYSKVQKDFLASHIPAAIMPQIVPRKVRLNATQLPIFTSIQTDGNYNKCDCNMLYTLIRNLATVNAPVNGWGNAVDINAFNVADDLECLRSYRNVADDLECLRSYRNELYTATLLVYLWTTWDTAHYYRVTHKGCNP